MTVKSLLRCIITAVFTDQSQTLNDHTCNTLGQWKHANILQERRKCAFYTRAITHTILANKYCVIYTLVASNTILHRRDRKLSEHQLLFYINVSCIRVYIHSSAKYCPLYYISCTFTTRINMSSKGMTNQLVHMEYSKNKSQSEVCSISMRKYSCPRIKEYC